MTTGTSSVHRLRRELRAALAGPDPVVGTFVKLPVPEVAELALAAGYNFVVIDLEHSALSESDAIELVRHADVCGLPALVRIPAVDGALVNRLLEAGAVGIQLSMLIRTGQVDDLLAATRFAPSGARSMSLANRVAGFGAVALNDFLELEANDPPILVGQLESAETDDPLPALIPRLDVCFVGSTDLAVDLGPVGGPEQLRAAVSRVHDAACAASVAFGGWAPSLRDTRNLGLTDADYLVVGSDLQLLAAGLRAAAQKETP